jgi:HlyD family secretion protein
LSLGYAGRSNEWIVGRDGVSAHYERPMARRRLAPAVAAAFVILAAALAYWYLGRESAPPPLLLSRAARRELMVVISTNGIIEPVDRIEVYAPIDAFVTDLRHREGAELTAGRPLMRLESPQLMTSIAEAKAVLLQAKREAQRMAAGPSKEELAPVDAEIAEIALQLDQRREDLRREEALLPKDATTKEAVENLRKQVSLLALRIKGLQDKKQGLLDRYSDAEKQLEQDRVVELNRQVEVLERQVLLGSIMVPRSGLLFSLPVRPGSFVNRGQLLAELYRPGNVRLRAYVDEPDLGRVAKGQKVLIEWDGLPDQSWQGVVDELAEQAVALGNRSVGYVICKIADEPTALIPNINVKVQVVTASKAAALVVPRTAVFNNDGSPAVLLSSDGIRTTVKPVTLGLITPEEVEIVQGIEEGNQVVTNPAEARNR